MTVVIEQRWIVGRDETCDVRVSDEYASPRHCEVARTADGRFFVRDLGSTNGTRLRVTTTNAIGEPRTRDIKVYGWTPIVPGQALVVGRSQIPWRQS